MNMFIETYVELPVYETFIYSVPKELEEKISVGKRALVPFGKRKLTAYIINISDIMPDTGFEIKEIISVEDKIALFSKKLLSFFEWISSYYIYPPGLVIKSALPSGINPNIVRNIKITPEGQKNILHEKSTLFLNLLKTIELNPRNEKELSDAGFSNKDIYALEKKGFVEITDSKTICRTKEKFEKFIERTQKPGTLKLTEKQVSILKLIPAGETILKKDISSKIINSSSTIKSLVKKGLLKEIYKKVSRAPLGETVVPDNPPELTDEQLFAVKKISGAMDNSFKRYLLFGITGSGKTEVYLGLAQKALNMNKTALVLVPEISLISQTEARFKARFPDNTAVIHSGLSHGEKLDQWMLIVSGERKVVIGARSAIFAPLENIGIIIVDEEHDQSYKQDSSPGYNARDMAVVRAQIENCPVVLGSATPSLETWTNAVSGKFEKLSLKKRANNSSLPEVFIHDLKKSAKDKGVYKLISYSLALEINKTISKNEQVLLFLNKRGFSSFLLCNVCGEAIKCSFCSVTKTYHKADESLVCHICGNRAGLPEVCPGCLNPQLVHLGAGTEKIEKACNFLFPKAKTIRLDQDTTRKKGELLKKLRMIRDKKADIIIGTQMIAKGHDFPDITLVGVINADMGFNLPDFRAAEKTFQVLSQVAGRAGRGEKKGSVIMQTYNPEHFSIQTARTQNFENFYKREIVFRKSLFYPPFSKTALIKISGESEEKTRKLSGECKNKLMQIINEKKEFKKIIVMGPAKSPLYKAASRFRFQILLKSEKSIFLNYVLKELKKKLPKLKKSIRISFDIDPYSMM